MRAKLAWTVVAVFVMVSVSGCSVLTNFINTKNRGDYSACSSSLTMVKTAVEMAAAESPGENGVYGNVTAEKVCDNMLRRPGCGAADIEANVGKTCVAPGGGAWTFQTGVDFSNPDTYRIVGEIKKVKCPICVTPNGMYPEAFKDCGVAQCP